ncbi:MAG: SCP2 sterol-binding domain-containing protein [Actinomycetota bacterium]|nr:SCP2 sterol-binding domain-containing protein [Actinomycetota bacterium]
MLYKLGELFLKAIMVLTHKNIHLKERLIPLNGKIFALKLTEFQRPYIFNIEEGSIRGPLPRDLTRNYQPDVIFTGSLKVFMGLFLGRIDPDAAFFRRRITVEGSLTMALTLKNIFDDLVVI